MVDNRAAGFYGVSGALNFKSGDISGTAAKTNEEKYGSDAEYMKVENEDEQTAPAVKYTDKSAQLNATLSSLAMMNIASVISSKLPKITQTTKRFKEMIDETEELIVALNEEQEKKQNQNHSNPFEENDEEEEKSSLEFEDEEEYY